MSKKDDSSWAWIILGFIFCWPVGLFLLFRKLYQGRVRLPSKGKMSFWACALGAYGVYRIVRSLNVGSVMLGIFFLIGGGAIYLAGRLLKARDLRLKKYVTVIGRKRAFSIEELARAIPVPYETAARDIQELINQGALGASAYIDAGKRTLFLDADEAEQYVAAHGSTVYVEPEAEPEPEPEPRPEPRREAPKREGQKAHDSVFEDKLREIRRANEEILDEKVSAKIYRIEALTASIFKAVEEAPNKRAKINSFMNYYLPTTLKLLTRYSQLEAQPATSESITSAMKNIEDIMDKLVQVFEQQLDTLYRDDVIDITADINVLETMMARDGIGANEYVFKKAK